MKSSFCIDLQRFMLIPTKFPLSLELVHHLDMVVLSFPNCSANHLFVRCLSARTTLIRFKFLLAIFAMNFIIAKVQIKWQQREYYYFFTVYQ